MRMRFLTLLVIAAGLVAPAAAQTAGQEATEPRVILISIDGLLPSSYTNPSSPAVNLKKLAAEGVWSEGVVGVLPTVTLQAPPAPTTGRRVRSLRG